MVFVGDAMEVGRQLARATPGEPGEPLPDWPLEVVKS
jgi:hypothetical protein